MNNADKPAYPTNARMHSDAVGLTKKEYFAALAMQGLLANPQYMMSLEDSYRRKAIHDMNGMLARESVDMADELLNQLEISEQPERPVTPPTRKEKDIGSGWPSY